MNILNKIIEIDNLKNEKLMKNLEEGIKHLPILKVDKEGKSFSQPLEIGEVTFPEKVEMKKGYVGDGNYSDMPTRTEEESKYIFYIMGRTADNKLIGTQNIKKVPSPACKVINNAVDYKKKSDYIHNLD